ncbi:hypothetical protein ES703_17715 [subsurface metagenome]
MKKKVRRYLYYGDEIEVSSVQDSYESKKTLSCVIHPFLDRPTKLIVAVTLKTSDESKQASLGLFVDGAASPAFEKISSSTDYGLQIGKVNAGGWAEGLHALDLKLKTEAGGTAYNQLFEIYYETPNN